MRRRYNESIKRYPVRFREDIGPYVTIGGKRYPLDDNKYDPRLSADEVMDRFDKEYKADEEEKAEKVRKAEIEKKAKNIIAKNKKLLIGESDYKDKYKSLLNEYVYDYGKSDSLGGEILRAVNKIDYRWNNDKDIYFIGYGKKSCGPAARFLVKLDDEDHVYLEDLSRLLVDFADEISRDASDANNYYSTETFKDYMNKKYDSFLNKLIKLAVDVVIDHPELFLEDTIDMYDADEYDFEEPMFDYYIDYPKDLSDYLDSDIITRQDICDYVDKKLSWTSIKRDNIQCNLYSFEISELDYDSYNELDSENENNSFFDEYIEELKSEYGTPDEWEEEEEDDEDED